MTRKELVKNKFPEQFEKALSITDYSNGKNKYLVWIAKQLEAGHNESDISATLKFFHENQNRFDEKNIGRYKDLKDLENIIKDMGLSKRKERENKKSASLRIYEDDNCMVVRVDDKEAMVYYGANTQWCTTMKEHTYYEDYVSRGTDFYIIIRKNPNAFKAAKYAVARTGLLDFEVFDENDHTARSFSDKETHILKKPVQAIVADTPPKNFLWKICKKKVSIEESSEWLKHQSETTQKWAGSKVPQLRFVNKTPEQIIEYIFENTYGMSRRFKEVKDALKDEGMLQKIAKEMTKAKYNNRNYYPLKLNVVSTMSSKDALIFKDDKDARIRASVASKVDPEDAPQFFVDRSTSVLKNAATQATISEVLDFLEKTKSRVKKDIVQNVLLSRIPGKKLVALITKQPRDDVIKMAS